MQGLETHQRARQLHEPDQDVGPPLIADLEASIAHQPGQRPLHHIPMPAESLARLDATPGDPWRDPTPAQRPPAARVVLALVQMQLDRALAGPPGPPPRSLDRPDGVHHGLEQQRVVGVGGRQAGGQGDTMAVDQQVILGAELAAIGGFGPVRQPPAWPAR